MLVVSPAVNWDIPPIKKVFWVWKWTVWGSISEELASVECHFILMAVSFLLLERCTYKIGSNGECYFWKVRKINELNIVRKKMRWHLTIYIYKFCHRYCTPFITSITDIAHPLFLTPANYIYIYIYVYVYRMRKELILYIYIYISSSSCRAASTDIPDPFSPLLPIIHLLRQFFRVTSCVLT